VISLPAIFFVSDAGEEMVATGALRYLMPVHVDDEGKNRPIRGANRLIGDAKAEERFMYTEGSILLFETQ